MNPTPWDRLSPDALPGDAVPFLALIVCRANLKAGERVRLRASLTNTSGREHRDCRLRIVIGESTRGPGRNDFRMAELKEKQTMDCDATGSLSEAGDTRVRVSLETGGPGPRRRFDGEVWLHVSGPAAPKSTHVSINANNQTGGDSRAAANIFRGGINVQLPADGAQDARATVSYPVPLREDGIRKQPVPGSSLWWIRSVFAPGRRTGGAMIPVAPSTDSTAAPEIPTPPEGEFAASADRKLRVSKPAAVLLAVAGVLAIGALMLWAVNLSGGDSAGGRNPEKTTDSPELATRFLPFRNALGMLFVPVDTHGNPNAPFSRVLAAVTETTVGSYRPFVEWSRANQRLLAPSLDARPDGGKAPAAWDDPGYSQTDGHPVSCVSKIDAAKYCVWLTERDRIEWPRGKWYYRLPDNHEWDCLAGLVNSGISAAPAPDKSAANTLLHPAAAPVIASLAPPNTLGIKGAGGNLREWTSSIPLGGDGRAMVRDYGWTLPPFSIETTTVADSPPDISVHDNLPDHMGYLNVGFRIVLELVD